MSSPGSDANDQLPDVDDRLVAPGCGYEIDDGKLVRVPPAREPHAERHSKLAALLEAHVIESYKVAIDMLTRVSETSDLAPDAAVYLRAPNPVTGGRHLEEIIFEIASTESLAHAGGKAAKFSNRGVRRVFAIDIEHARVLEWSRELGTWSMLHPDSEIDDPTFVRALPVRELADTASADDAVARALLAKRNVVLLAAIADERIAERRAAISAVLSARGLEPSEEERVRLVNEPDGDRLARWHRAAVTCTSIAAMLAIE